MKTYYKLINAFQKFLVAFGIAFCFLPANPIHAAKTPEVRISTNERNPGNKISNKENNNLNNESVKIYPGILKRTMHVIAKETDTKEIEFIVFDMKRSLVLNYKMKEGSHKRITGLARGQYTYHVFSGNSETATGTFVIK